MSNMGKEHFILDQSKCDELCQIVEDLTTSGKPDLDKDLMKKLRAICRLSDTYVTKVFNFTMTQLDEDHAEVRYSALLLTHELFKRSHHFRELLLSEFKIFMALTLETDSALPLPPPKAAAKKLKIKAIELIHSWQAQFGSDYKRLSLAYKFLEDCKKIDFVNVQAENLAERQREEQRLARQEAQRAEQLAKAVEEMKETTEEIDSCLTQIDSCLNLLLPAVCDFMGEETVPSTEKNCDGLKPANSQASQFGKVQTRSRCESNQDTSGTLGQNAAKADLGDSGVDSDRTDNGPSCQGDASDEKSKCSATPSCPHSDLPSSPGPPDTEAASEQMSDVEEFSSSEDEDGNVESDVVRQHGLGSLKYSIDIEVHPDVLVVNETADNTDLLSALHDSLRLINGKFIPAAQKWLEVFARCGGNENMVKQAINIKDKLNATRAKILKIKVNKMPGGARTKGNDEVAATEDDEEDDDDDGFEEVPEKEGYEECVPPYLLQDDAPSKMKPRASTSRDWKLPTGRINARRTDDDPTTWQATVRKIKEQMTSESNCRTEASTSGSTSPNSSNKTPCCSPLRPTPLSPGRGRLLKKAPVLPFGVDLYHWGEEKKEAPKLVRYEDGSHIFWRPIDDAVEGRVDQVALAAMKSRVMHFTGETKHIKWKCRAPMPNGTLCDRQDKVKCPFHGRIIARDVVGRPCKKEDQERLAREKEKRKQDETPEWEDAELQQDIQAATGVDLTRKGKGQGRKKGKGLKKKYPGLTDVKKMKNTTRHRLETKVLNRGSMKRVAETMDGLDAKRYKDKFANQFNYQFS